VGVSETASAGCTDHTPLEIQSDDARWIQVMVARTGFLLTLGLSAFLVVWWAVSGFPVVSAVCKEANYLAPYRGPFSSLCLQHLLSSESADSRESI
jgi:hypothetical protein